MTNSQETQSTEALSENVVQAADVVTAESEEAKKEQELEAKAAIIAQAKAANEAATEDPTPKPALSTQDKKAEQKKQKFEADK
jgi:hypothetical protein